MTNLEQYAFSVQAEKWWEYFFCRGCEACPAHEYCRSQPIGTCCRENFFGWAQMEAADAPNDPLTLDELREMDGEPVYILRLEDIDGFWIVIRSTAREKLTTDYGGYFCFAGYGKTWLAYRRKPEGGGE